MSTQKAKFQLFQRLQNLGFTYEEAVALRRIEMTLHRWAEAECNGEIQRDEKTGKPERVWENAFHRHSHPVADRETGALKRLAAIVEARNARLHREATANRLQNYRPDGLTESDPVIPYHQTDPRGCALYLLTRRQLGADKIDRVYTRGLAVCA